MAEIMVFALTLVAAQIIGWMIVMSIMTSRRIMKRWLKGYTKMIMEVSTEIQKELDL